MTRILTSLATLLLVAISTLHAAAGKPNVLFIATDDMRPQLGCYGDPLAKSPNLDRLAARGMVFNRAYCQQALCSPSRISLLTGRHPWTTKIYEIGPFLRETMPDVVTLPQHFKNSGYFTRSLGKIFHVGIDDPQSWSVPPWHSKKPRYGPLGSADGGQAHRRASKPAESRFRRKARMRRSMAARPLKRRTWPTTTFWMATRCARRSLAMGELAKKPEQPFFLAVGFANPHVPWVAPKKYWDLYRTEELPLPENRYAPKNAPAFAATSGADFYWYANVPKDRKIMPEFGRQCLHGYLAAISYVDAGVGRLLGELDRLGLRDKTIVIFWGDHGYYMGEHNWWGGKHNNYEGATRAPLIVSAPGMKAAGKKTDALVEFVDIYPSLADLCGLPLSGGLEGRSFMPLLDDPQASVGQSRVQRIPERRQPRHRHAHRPLSLRRVAEQEGRNGRARTLRSPTRPTGKRKRGGSAGERARAAAPCRTTSCRP